MSFPCYDNFDVIATLIITNFHLHLMQVEIFPNLCYWQRDLCSYVRGTDPENPIELSLRRRKRQSEEHFGIEKLGPRAFPLGNQLAEHSCPRVVRPSVINILI